MKLRWEWLAPFFPVVLGVIIVIVLDALGVIQFELSSHALGPVIVLVGLIITIIIVSVRLSREALRQTNLENLRQTRAEQSAERSRFLRRLDHELKNPVMGIQLAVTNLAATDDFELRQRLRESIQRQVMRLSRIVTDLRKLADLSSQPLEQFPVDLTDLLQEIYAEVTENTPLSERDLHLTLPQPPQAGLPVMIGDRDLLSLAFYNLLDNALKYTQIGDQIELRASAQEQTAVVEVRDTGMGIAAEDLPYIWDELFRSAQAREIPGSGIGLALVKLIIERHGGKIEAQSQLNQGTIMRVYLPIMPSAGLVSKLMQPVSRP